MKEKELANEKEETRMLQEKLRALERQHLVSDTVKVDKKIKEKINQVRQSVLTMAPLDLDQNKGLRIHNPQMLSFSADTSGQLQVPSENGKQIVRALKHQIKNLENEIKDIGHENYLDKEMILNDIRELSKENKLLEGIVSILLSPKELVKVKGKI